MLGRLLKQTSLPKHLIWLIPVVCFVLSSIYTPYVVDADTALSMKIAQQFFADPHPPFHSLIGADPTDLSKDRATWVTWYSPGVAAIYSWPLLLHLPMGWSLKLFSLLLYLLGAWGFWKIIQNNFPHLPTQWMLSLTLPASYLAWLGATSLSGDTISFALIPWIVFYSFNWLKKIDSNERNFFKLAISALILGLASGGISWFKLSGSLISLSFHIAISLVIIFRIHHLSTIRRFFLAVLLGIGNLLPILLLVGVTFHYSGQLSGMSDMQQFALNCPSTKGIFLILSTMGALGFWLFHLGAPVYHVLFFMEKQLPIVQLLGDHTYRVVHLGWIFLPFSILGYSALIAYFREKRDHHTLVALLTLIFSCLLLAYSSYKCGFNCLTLSGPRYISIIFPWINAYLFYIFWNYINKKEKRFQTPLKVLLLSLAIIPTLFIYSVFIKQKAIDHLHLSYPTTHNALYFEYLPQLPEITAKVNDLTTSPLDVVVIAHTGGGYFGPWIEFPQRILPLVDTWGHLVRTYGPGGNIFADTPYSTSKPLRIIIVATSSFTHTPEALNKLQSRFPQSQKWEKQQIGETEIWHTDLLP